MPPGLRQAGWSVTVTLLWASCPGWGSATGTRSARRLALATLGRPGPWSGSEVEMGYVRQWARARNWGRARARAKDWATARGWATASARARARARARGGVRAEGAE